MPQLESAPVARTDLISEVARIHKVKITAVGPAAFDNLVLEYATQDHRTRSLIIVKVSGVSRLDSAAGSKHVDVRICTLAA
jgi:hypothetical protein